MKHRKAAALMGLATTFMVAGTLFVPSRAEAAPVLQDPPTRTMWVIGRGNVQVIPLHDAPEALGKAMKRLPTGSPVEVFTDQLYNKYWYKTSEGFYAHVNYLTDVDPATIEGAVGGGVATDVDYEREAELLEKYGDLGLVSNLMAGIVNIGYTMDMVRDAWGNPDTTTILETTALGDNVQWIYSGREDRNPKTTTTLKFDYRKKVIDIKAEK